MSSTRTAKAGEPVRQERYCSAVEFDDGLKALPVAKRSELVADPEMRALIWFLQFRSLPPREQGIGRIGGVRRIADELFPLVHSAIVDRGGFEIDGLRGRSVYLPDINDEAWCADAVAAIWQTLLGFCINPARRAFPALHMAVRGGLTTSDEPALSGAEFLAVVRAYRSRVTSGVADCIAQTDVARRVQAMLSFTFETGRACLIEGAPRTGKSCAAKAFCEAHPGLARYVVTPPGCAEQDLLRAIADALGVADSSAYKNVQIRAAVEEVLRRSRIALIFDEAQWLLPQHVRVQSLPQRLLYVKMLIDWSVPVAFVALPEFSRLLANVGAKTGWSIEQITGRVVYERLPDALSESDLRAIVASHLPDACDATSDLIVGSALQDKDQAGTITKIIDFARFLAKQRSLGAPQFDDFRKAALAHHRPSSSVFARTPPAQPPRTPRAPAATPPRIARGISAEPRQAPVLGGRLSAAGVADPVP